MKDSSIECIGDIPVDWEVRKLGGITDVRDGTHDSPKYHSTGIPFITSKNLVNGDIHWENANYISERDHAKFSIRSNVDDGDLLFGMIGTVGNPVLVKKEFEFSIKNMALIKFNKGFILNSYLYYLFLSECIEKQFSMQTNSSVQTFIALGSIRNLKIPLPQLNEQQQIARYLDEKVGQIDIIIDKTKSSIDEYKAYKQSVITETVTKGLDKTVTMKDSGIEWIGEIPEHWNIDKIKRITYVKGRIGWQGLKTSEFIETGPYLITGTDFEDGIINWNTCVHITEARYDEANYIQVQEGDLLITKDGTVGKLAIVTNMPDKTSVNSGVFVTRPLNDKYVNKFLYYVMDSEIFWKYFRSSLTGNSTILHLYQNVFEQFWIPLPDTKTQDAIVEYLDAKLSEVNSLIAKKQQLITELEAYKKSMIYEVVTGKKEVK